MSDTTPAITNTMQTASGAAGGGEERPLERRRQRVRDLIIGAAEALFAQHGEAGLTIRRIAEEIDYSAGAIYQYFQSKEDILHEIREMFFARLLARLDQVTADRDMSVDCMLDGLEAYIACGLDQPNHYRMAFATGATRGAFTVESNVYEAAMRLEGMFAGAVEAGVIPPVNVRLAATSVWPCLHGLTILMVEDEEFPTKMPGSENVARSAVMQFHLKLLVRGLGASVEITDDV